jgi:hypothetical protein
MKVDAVSSASSSAMVGIWYSMKLPLCSPEKLVTEERASMLSAQ